MYNKISLGLTFRQGHELTPENINYHPEGIARGQIIIGGWGEGADWNWNVYFSWSVIMYGIGGGRNLFCQATHKLGPVAEVNQTRVR